MSESAIHLFINPAAGRGRAAKRARSIVDLLDAEGIATQLIESRAAGDIEQRIAELPEPGHAIVAGGDGSIHEAVNGIVRSGKRIALGVIPTGTGNDFAKAIAIDLDWQVACVDLAARIRSRRPGGSIDIGRMNERLFANGAGIGLDARVTRIARSHHLPIGDLVYLLAIFDAMREGIATPEIRISGDAEWNGAVTLVSVSNGPFIGGMFHIAPMADNRDGKLELLIAAPVSRLRVFGLLPKLIRGRHMAEPEIRHHPVARLLVEADAPLESHLDGEVQPLAERFEFELLPDALQLL